MSSDDSPSTSRRVDKKASVASPSPGTSRSPATSSDQKKKNKRSSARSRPLNDAQIAGNSSEENLYDSPSTSEMDGLASDGGPSLLLPTGIVHPKLSRRSNSSLSASGDNSSPSKRASKNSTSTSRKSRSKASTADQSATDSVVEFYMQGSFDDPMTQSLEWESTTTSDSEGISSGRTPSPHAPHVSSASPAVVPRLRRSSSSTQSHVVPSVASVKSPRREHSSRSVKSPRGDREAQQVIGAPDPLEDDALTSSMSSLNMDDSYGPVSPRSIINSFLEEIGFAGAASALPASASQEVFFKENGDANATSNSDQPASSSQISHATVAGLVSLLANPQSFQDKSFIDTFILSYEYFTDSPTFLKRLMGLYFLPAAQTSTTSDDTASQQRVFFQLRVINVLKKLIETRYFSLRRDKRCYQLLRNFLRALLRSGDDREKSLVVALRQSMKQNADFVRPSEKDGASSSEIGQNLLRSGSGNEFSSSPPVSNATLTSTSALMSPNSAMPFSLGPQKTLLDYHQRDLARHLTLIEYELWSCIKLDEFYHTAFSSKEKDKLAPNINRFIKRFNDVSAWVASSVVLAPKKKQRVAVLTRLIQIMDELRRIQNLNGMMAFFSALSLGAIQRLKKTWKDVPSKVMQIWSSASKFMDSSGGYKLYKEFLHSADPPAVPYMGFILRDLDFAEEFPTWVAKDGRLDEDASSSSESHDEDRRKKAPKSPKSSRRDEVRPSSIPLGRTSTNKYVNWTKMQWLAQCFGDVLRFQRTRFPFAESKDISEFVADLSRHSWFLSDAELNEMSRNIEPEPSDAAVVAAALQPPDGAGLPASPGKSSRQKDSSGSSSGKSSKKSKEKRALQYEDLIRDPQLFADFRKHLESRFNSENLLFWESVYKFKTTVDFTDSSEAKKRADEILTKFVTGTADNSRFMVGLNSSVSRDIKRQVDRGDITPIIFDRAVDEVEHVTLRPAFQEMLRSQGN